MTPSASAFQRVLAALTAVALVVAQLALPMRAEATHVGSSTASAGSAPPPSVSAIQSFQPDLFTGRATTAIPIAVPPGRKGMQPSLALTYSSSGRNGWLGVGWSLDVGYIERSTKEGVPKYDTSDTYTFMFQGVSSDLVRIPDGTYRAKDEGLFLRFESKGTAGWEVTDKSGSRYRFGQTVASQVESTGHAFRWGLDEVIDLNGNTLTISYTKDRGQLYPAQIRYTGHAPTRLAPANQVDVLLEDRPDVETSLRSGFTVTTAKRLKTVETLATVEGSLALAHRYQLRYAQSPRTGRSLLASITPIGHDGATSLPATTFTYTRETPTYLHCHNCVPALSTGNHGWQVQVQVAHRFPHNEGGNDQRLWPSGAWEPGVKTWNEKVCRRRFFITSCHDEPRAAAIPSVSWSRPFLELSGSSEGVRWSTDANSNLSVSGPQDSHLLAMTWLYTATAKTVSLSSLSTGGRAEVFYVTPGGSAWSVATGGSVPLAPGWTFLALTAYNETGSFSLSMAANLASHVTAMNHAQFSPMGLAGDFNGDGLTDLAHVEPADNHWHVILNTGSGFTQEQTWLMTALPRDTLPLVGDVDSDGKADLILWNASSGLWQVAKSTGSSFQAPVTWHTGFGGGQTPLMGDFNGDQRLDAGAVSSGAWLVALSTGSGFGSPTTWLAGVGAGASPLTGDFNGDGLTDVAAASGGTVSVALSDGSRLVSQPTAWTTGFGAGQSVTSADLNGDGLTDLVYYDKATGVVVAAPSTGTRFGTAQTLMEEHPFELRGADDTLQVGDFRGNGLAGFGVFNALSGAAEIAFALGTPPDLLETTANGVGGSTTLTYQPSSQFTNTNLHFAIPVVTKTATSDGMGHTYTTTYTYSGGRYDPATQEFRGFATATVADAIGTTTTTTFSQDLHTKGRPLSAEVRDHAGRLFTKTTSTWSCTEPYPGVHFARLEQTESAVYDGDASFKQTRSRFRYDDYGNLTEALEDGQVDPPLTGDERTTLTTFAYNPTDWILNRPSLTQTRDAAGTLLAQRRFYYDEATATTTPPTVGRLTKEEEWRNLPAEQWLATTLTYDPFGNVKTVTDARERTTTNTYDATGTSLIQIANAVGHTRQLVYDPRFGQVLSSTDQNTVTTATEYDALGRVTKVIGPTETASLPTIEYEYDLSTVPTKTVTHTRIQSGSTLRLTHYAFHDGVGRTIQTRSPAEDPTKQIVSGAVEFDSRGLVTKQWVSYFSNLSSSYVPFTLEPSPSTLAAVSYLYDAVGRLIQTTDPDGSITLTDYHDGETTVTPPVGAQIQRLVDAYGRLILVEEVLSPSERFRTTYAYNALNNLTTVTDHAGHVTTIAYDALSRKRSMDDPDMGHWEYTYDAVDNLTSQTDARGVVTTFTYDALHRLTQKSYTVPPGSGVSGLMSPVSYSYDNPAKAFSNGKLTEITDGSGSSSFEYDQLGRLVKEAKTIDSTTSTIQRAYDLLGRLVTLTYPDTDVAGYTYNPQGGIETIDLFSSLTQSLTHVLTDVTYNAAGQLTKLTYGNGTVSDYTYHPQTLRLSSLRTSNSQLQTLQDFSYSFDALGNLTEILDRVHTATQAFQYDPLNRLTNATGSYGAFTYAYDPIGNMTSKEGATMTYGLPNGSKPHAVTAVHGPQSTVHRLTYDANGNLVEKAVDGGPSTVDVAAQRLTYDAENRLVEVKTAPEETVTIRLEPGWNFFSLPVIPEDLRIQAIFPTFAADLKQLAWFDADVKTPEAQRFQHFVHHPKFNQFDTLAYGQGYQLYCKNPNGVTLTLKGKLPTQPLSTTLLPGWHLLPAVTLESKPVSWLTQGVEATAVHVFDATTQTLQPATTVEPGQAYFVNVRTTSLFTPPRVKDPTTRFVYDGDGGRVKQITAAGTTTFLGASYELAPDGTTTKYVFAGSQRLAALTSNVPLRTSNLRFYHGDHLGSSNVITDGAGQLVELAEYTPYGSLSRREGTTTVPQKFTGQRLDSSTGLYFYNARYYDPALGRFIQADPVVPVPGDPQALNRYSYVRNNPLTYTDPSGHGWRKVFGWVSTALSVLLPPLAPFLMAANIGLGLYDAARTGNWGSFIGSTLGSLVGGAIGGSLGKGLGLGMASGMLQAGASRGFAGVVGGAAEFGLAGFGSGFGGALGGGASLSEAFQAGGLSAALSGGLGAAIQGSYLAGWQDTLHGFDRRRLAYEAGGGGGGGGVPPSAGWRAGARSGRGGSTWGNPKTLPGHFARHGADFKAKNLADYARQASEFLQRALRQGSPTKIDSEGVTRVYDPKTNTFGSYNPDGTTRTFFKPSDAMDYWERQEGVNP